VPAFLIGNGGLGHAIDARYVVTGYPGFRGLQIVQVFYGTPTPGDPDGLYEFRFNGRIYRGFVDGGHKSRNVLQAADQEHVPNRPYYWRQDSLAFPNNYGFDATTGHGQIAVYDVPMGMRIHDAGYFETAIVAVPATNAPDEVVHVLRWGWTNNGMTYQPAPETPAADYAPLASGTVSQIVRDIVRDNYPAYRYIDASDS
jgi:hypothetical protein